ncbi:MAG: helix-turn-helix transcriptional regulator [Rhodospirillales bacterium]|nr:helix-turn-helix transcriptional regulator [Rhodospirillales bacterium]
MVRIATTRQTRERERLAHIGEAIRAARKQRRMTLDALAREVGLSVTFLSRLERGQVACSIGNLLEIAAVLELAPAQLFADLDDGARTKAFRIVRRADASPAAHDRAGPYAWCQLASGVGEQRMESFLSICLPTRRIRRSSRIPARSSASSLKVSSNSASAMRWSRCIRGIPFTCARTCRTWPGLRGTGARNC